MRLKNAFSIPFAIYEEPMPSKAFKLLAYLFSESDFSGQCRPGYDAMRKAIRDDPAENGSNTTVRHHLRYLERRGWVFHMKKTNGRMAIWLQIPPRLQKASKVSKEAPVSLISVVQ